MSSRCDNDNCKSTVYTEGNYIYVEAAIEGERYLCYMFCDPECFSKKLQNTYLPPEERLRHVWEQDR